jgi:hypothetical protein
MAESDADKIHRDIYRNMSHAQKWQEFLKIRKAAWELKAAGLRHNHPDWTEEQIQEKVREIFLYATT